MVPLLGGMGNISTEICICSHFTAVLSVKDYTSANNRAYYAIFYAMRASF